MRGEALLDVGDSNTDGVLLPLQGGQVDGVAKCAARSLLLTDSSLAQLAVARARR